MVCLCEQNNEPTLGSVANVITQVYHRLGHLLYRVSAGTAAARFEHSRQHQRKF